MAVNGSMTHARQLPIDLDLGDRERGQQWRVSATFTHAYSSVYFSVTEHLHLMSFE